MIYSFYSLERVNQLEQQDQPELQSLKDDLYLILSQREELLLRCKKEFLEFLEISNYYDAAGILQKLENTQFLEERAVWSMIEILNRLFYQN